MRCPRLAPKLFAALAAAAFVVSCGGSSGSSGSGSMPGMNMGTSSLPGWAGSLKVRIVSPSGGIVVTGTELPLQLAFSGFQPDCLLAGTPVKRGTGHLHVYLDGRLVGMFCTAGVDLSMQNVKPGSHTVMVEPALNDHQVVTQNAVHLAFSYQPSSPLPWISPAPLGGKPSIKIIAPTPGTTVEGTFDLTVEVESFELSCPLQGKAAVAGTGDWNLNHDSLQTGMSGMSSMVRISCVPTIEVSTEGLKPGEHTFLAYLADNEGTALVPLATDQIALTVR